MMKKIRIVLMIVIGFVFLGFAVPDYSGIAPEEQINTPRIGEEAPDMEFLTVDRQTTYKLSDLRGKMVLIDFWASWCTPCRYENPNVVAVYKKYKDTEFTNATGFTVYGVSLDNNLESWKRAIGQDKLAWPYHVSDLKGWNSEPASMYNVKGIPTNYLIDGNGVIVAKNLRREKLEEAIKKYVK